MSVRAFQRGFSTLLRAGDTPAADPPGPNAAGLAVYRHAYRARLHGALSDTFARTQAWLGSEPFADAADGYIDARPPTTRNLGDYGEDFPWLLRQRHPQAWEMAELAWLDWQLRRAFDGPDAPPVATDDWGTLDWEHARLRFVPTLRLHQLHSNAAAIWRALAAGESAPPPQRLPAPQPLRVWRRDWSPHFQSMPAEEADALRMAVGGMRFGQLCRTLDAADPTVAGALLGQWLADGVLARVEPAEASVPTTPSP